MTGTGASSGRRVAVVVLGDLARSPRILNHVHSLVRRGFEVALIGYRETALVVSEGVVVIPLHPLRRAGDRAPRWLFLLWSAVRMCLLAAELGRGLLRVRPSFILMQNPPSFPTLHVAVWAARWSKARLVVDWHNYGNSMLASRLGAGHIVVRLARWYEFRWGRRAHAHLCVSNAFRDDLESAAGIRARVLYDRPVTISPPRKPPPRDRDSPQPLRVVCPAGWTADEDLDLLARALADVSEDTPAIEIDITGDGPAHTELAPRLETLARRGLVVRTGFLPEEQYRDLLRRSDAGLSLHCSTSGLDLAMKVSDLYAAGVPVCALSYAGSLAEQVRDGVTGFLFSNARELTALIEKLARHPECLEPLRANIAREWNETWDDAWQREAAPLFDLEGFDRRES